MKQRKIAYSTQAILSILIILGILIIVNGISLKKFVRWDLTESKQYTISSSTKKILAGIDDIVTIKLYFSKNLPPVMRLKEQQVKDLLDEYRAFSKGNIVIKREDPASDEQLEKQVQSIGIPQVQMTFREKDQVEVKNGYLGMGIFYETRHEVLPIVQNVDNLEYDLTSAIKKVATNQVPKVAFLAGHNEKDLTKEFAPVKGALDQQYETVAVDTTDGQPIPPDINTLIIAGPRKDLTDREMYEIDQFLMRGGKIIALIDTLDLDLQAGLFANPLQLPNFEKLFQHFGIKVNTDLVLDKFNDRLTYSESPNNVVQYITTVNYPFFVRAIKKNFDQSNPILRALEAITLPWTSSISLLDANLKGANVIKLIQSSEYAWNQSGNFNLNPKQEFKVPPDQEKQFLLTAVVENQFESYFKGKPIPEAKKSEGDNEAKPEATVEQKPIEKSPQTFIFVTGSSYFATSDALRRFAPNGVFFLNAVDWLTQGEDLIGIRSRYVSERPLKEFSEKTVTILKFANIFGMSLLIIAFGMFIFYWRRREKKMYESLIR